MFEFLTTYRENAFVISLVLLVVVGMLLWYAWGLRKPAGVGVRIHDAVVSSLRGHACSVENGTVYCPQGFAELGQKFTVAQAVDTAVKSFVMSIGAGAEAAGPEPPQHPPPQQAASYGGMAMGTEPRYDPASYQAGRDMPPPPPPGPPSGVASSPFIGQQQQPSGATGVSHWGGLKSADGKRIDAPMDPESMGGGPNARSSLSQKYNANMV